MTRHEPKPAVIDTAVRVTLWSVAALLLVLWLMVEATPWAWATFPWLFPL